MSPLLPLNVPGSGLPDDGCCFQTDESVLRERMADAHPYPAVRVGAGVDEILWAREGGLSRPLSWTGSAFEDFGAWKTQVGGMLRAQLHIPGGEGAASEPDVIRTILHDDHIEEHLTIAVTPPLRARAVVLRPRHVAPPYPAIVGLHCMGRMRTYGWEKLVPQAGEPEYLTAYRARAYGGKSVAGELVRRGYLVIVIEAFHFGSRTKAGTEDFASFDAMRRSFGSEEESDRWSGDVAHVQDGIAARALLCRGLSIASLVATDDCRTVDYLLSRSDVDPARIGCVGLSFGAFRASYLTALDDRVKVGVSVCWQSSFSGLMHYNLVSSMGWFALPPDVYRLIDIPDIACMAAPKPFLAISGWRDPLMQPSGMAAAHLAVRRAYRAAGAASRLGSLVFDASHEFHPEMQAAAWVFLDRSLSPSPNL